MFHPASTVLWLHRAIFIQEACTVFLNWEAVKPVNRMSNGDHMAEQPELKQSRMSNSDHGAEQPKLKQSRMRNSDHGAEQPKLKQSVSSKYRTVAECLVMTLGSSVTTL